LGVAYIDFLLSKIFHTIKEEISLQFIVIEYHKKRNMSIYKTDILGNIVIFVYFYY